MNKRKYEWEVEVDGTRNVWMSAVWAFGAMALVVLLVVVISAVNAEAGHSNSYVPAPPARYDHLPVSYKIKYLPIETIWFTCLNLEAVGCSIRTPLLIKGVQVPCIVMVPNDAYLHLSDQIIRHEFGHCNGWHKSHPK